MHHGLLRRHFAAIAPDHTGNINCLGIICPRKASSMLFPKRATIVVSCLAIAGGAPMALGAATAADAAVRSVHQGWYPRDHHRQAQASHLSDRSLNANRTHERTLVINRFRLSNVSRNTNTAAQRQRQRDRASAAAAAGGGGGGGGGGGDDGQQQQQQQQQAAPAAGG
jgi:hypothetical protein